MELPSEWRKALSAVSSRLRESIASVSQQGLDPCMEVLEDLAVSVWSLREVTNDPNVATRFVEAFQGVLHKIAPPPPKKVKRDTPPRKILPLSEVGAVRGLDVIMLVRALVMIGDFTTQSDKARAAHLLFLDDWRRMLWDSATISSWEQFRKLCSVDPTWAARVPEITFSRRAAVTLLEAMAKYRDDHITPIPNVSMFACQKCRKFDGSERVRCHVCGKLFCGRCLARSAELCVTDYAARYATLAPELRTMLLDTARNLCRQHRLDEFTRNAAFSKALATYDVDVVFDEHAPSEGAEQLSKQGKTSLRIKDRENATTKKILFSALARHHYARLTTKNETGEVVPNPIELTPEQTTYFVDVCLGLPLEEALTAAAPIVPTAASPTPTP